MLLSSAEFDTLVSAFQHLADSLPDDPENDALIDRIESFLNALESDPAHRLTAGEIRNCAIALQFSCADASFSSPAHQALLQRFVALQFRSF